MAALPPQREPGAIVDALGAAGRNRDHVARAAGGEHVGHREHAHVHAFHACGRHMRHELQVIGAGLDRHQAVADTDFTATRALVQRQRGGPGLAVGNPGDGAGGELGQFIAQHAAARVGCVVGFPQVAAARGDVAVGVQVFARLGLGVAHGRADHGPALSQLGIGQVHVGGIATGHAQSVVLQADHLGQLLDAVDHAQLLQERLYLGQRNGVDRGLLARARLGRHGHPVQIGQAEHVTGIDQVRIGDLRIGLPDLRPQPRLLQETCGDIPQRIPFSDHIGVRVPAIHFHGGSIGSHGQHRRGDDRTKTKQHRWEALIPQQVRAL
ncbi:hypothetical protein G6F22_015664 [Rhizopus arrhizus]|nr:hypothetical protein G6F22_015664 [Rhizopus arrhizus]